MRAILVLGAGGFIGSHLVRKLKRKPCFVRAVDLKFPEFSESHADEFVIGDLREQMVCRQVIDRPFDEVYQLAADMGGAGYLFTGENDAEVMHNSAMVNLNILMECRRQDIKDVLYSSSACIYPSHNQEDPENPNCNEDSAYPANPDSEYGWEKLFSERVYLAHNRNKGMRCRIARLHNIFGPEGTWRGGREKAPAAICRKVAETSNPGRIEIWGDGNQTRSFLYIDECLEGMSRLMESSFLGPVNIGSDELLTINHLARMASDLSGKRIEIAHVAGPTGVRGRNSDNRLIEKRLGWRPSRKFIDGLALTYAWIEDQVRNPTQRIMLPESAASPVSAASLAYAR